MRVGTRLAGGFLLLILGFAGPLLFYNRVVDRSVGTAQELRLVDSRFLLSANSQLEQIDQLREDASKYRITGDSRYFDQYHARRSAFADTLSLLGDFPLTDQPRDSYEELASTWAEFEAQFGGDAGERAEANRLIRMSDEDWIEFGAMISRLEIQTRAMRLQARGSFVEKLIELSDRATQVSRFGWLALGGAVLLGVILAGFVVRSIARPLARIERGTAALARGDFTSRVEVRGRTEFAALAKRFNHMSDKLAELDLAKRDFLARVSHDLKTPLASIQETQRVLLDGAPGELNAKQRRLTELGLANTDRLSVMISRILELSRLEAGVEEYGFEPVDLAELCAQVIERFAPDGKPEIVLRGLSGGAPVLGDRGALERVLENLLDNARAHAGGGRIDVKVGTIGSGGKSRAVVGVRDRGPGVPEAQHTAIFQSFSHRGDVRLASGHVGLGLAICREIVAAHGGEIWVRSAEGGGSVFAFSIPMSKLVRKRRRHLDETEVAAAGVGTKAAGDRRSARSAAVSILILGLPFVGWGCTATASVPGPQLGLPAAEVLTVDTEPAQPIAELAAPHPFDLAYALSDWTAAADAFEADSTLLGDERALFRSGLLHAMPERPTFDLARATSRLERLLELFPDTSYEEPALVVLGLVDRLAGSARTLAAIEKQLEELKAVDLKDPVPPY